MNHQSSPFSASLNLNALTQPTDPKIQPRPPPQEIFRRPSFVSYLEVPNLPHRIKLLCEIIANTHSLAVETVLTDSGIQVNQDDVEDVLKLSYCFPARAVKFFRWAGRQLDDRHSPYAWNLVVDMLGKNFYFTPMWDVMRSMMKVGALSLATFASVFSSYVVANRVREAIMTFEVMEHYGCPRDVVALNSLLSAICRDGQTRDAAEFLRFVKDKISPDPDTYAILLEGWERDGNAASARETFEEMLMEIGWDPNNVSAYDSLLCTLVKGPEGMQEAMKYIRCMSERQCFPGLKFFKVALHECVKKSDANAAGALWKEMMERSGLRPATDMYNSMIALCFRQNNTDLARGLFDEMVCNGAFPDSETYNLLFLLLVKSENPGEAAAVFNEMVKNECVPSETNCDSAIRACIGYGDTFLAIKVWKCMVENYKFNLEETGNVLVLGLNDLNRVPEAVKYAEDMIDRGIKVTSSTLSKLKDSLVKVGKQSVYDELLRKWIFEKEVISC